uniref:C2H2-type domain-containing protein n=1 Tax=Heligmosomoides polygyrus TaxID=6339 RepID=A0A8L8KZN5_HELPZ
LDYAERMSRMYIRNNQQRDPSEIQHFLCYICGEVFRIRLEYQKHVVLHQSFGLIYQIYDSESQREANEEAGKGDPEKPGTSRQQSEKPEKKGKKKVVRRRSLEEMEEAIREEREQYLREKQLLAERKAEEDRQHLLIWSLRLCESIEHPVAFTSLAAELVAMINMKDQAFPVEKKKPPTKAKAADPVPPKTAADPKQPSSSLKSQRTPAVAQPVLPRTTSNGFDIGPPRRETCPFCDSDKIFYDPIAAIQHIVDHGASIADLKFVFFEDDKFIATEPQLSGDKCNACDSSFDFATQYYMHLLTAHRSAVALFYLPIHPNANNVEIVAQLVYRTLPEHTIEFREIIPKLAMRE